MVGMIVWKQFKQAHLINRKDNRMNNKEKEVIRNLCDCNMNVSQTARVMHCHRNTVEYYMEKIRKSTGLEPLRFYDLVKLRELVSSG